jgi:predicted metal-dependent hydrolase
MGDRIVSRAYRLTVSESLRRVIKASDRVTSQLELLAVVPPEETSEILAAVLAERGFEQQPDGTWRREAEGIEVTVDVTTAEVQVKSTVAQEVELEVEKAGSYYDETKDKDRQQLEERLRQHAREALEKRADDRAKELQRTATDELERKLCDLQPELDQVINRVTAEALKRKASRLGQIKEVTEDPNSGALTIVVEV